MLSADLTSHSFRRGAAQYTNANSAISCQWIFDRGGWKVSSINKGFTYITNTSQEDIKVSKVLSGWDVADSPWLPDYSVFDSAVRARIVKLEQVLFNNCASLPDQQKNLDAAVVEKLLSVAILHFPDVMALSESATYVTRVTAALEHLGLSLHELQHWSLTLRKADEVRNGHMRDEKKPKCTPASPTLPVAAPETKQSDSFDEQQRLLSRLLDQNERLNAHNQALDDRNRALEARLQHLERMVGIPASTNTTSISQNNTTNIDADIDASPPSIRRNRRQKAGSRTLLSAWFDFYTAQPPHWATPGTTPKQRFHELKSIVAFMKLFVPTPYDMRECHNDHRARVHNAGEYAQNAVLELLAPRHSTAKAIGTILRVLKQMEKAGELDERIRLHRTAVAAGNALDSLPPRATLIL